MGKFTKADLDHANARLGTIPFYPTSAASQTEIMLEMARMVPSKVALTWLVDAAVRNCKAWPGLGELRGLLCWKFAPADGVENVCSIHGYSPYDGEEKTYAEHQQLKSGGTTSEQDKALLRERITALLEDGKHGR